ncbi:hypothetical protein HJC04_04515 [Rhizobium sp. NLR8a]|uniref:hypothetical protein n=1 Tax=Rhizobium sp. NLR8a TaxID=2731119 RepID=UPI001C837E22|nr:hypothetical protein [Rhizobium sp. NLR8a]MBX5219587.1 hypothetical protein [Rhizobium sp. NLR8a]
MTNRVHIDAPSGVIEIEGEKEFVEGLLAKLFPLIEEAGFGSRPQGEADNSSRDDAPIVSSDDPAVDEQARVRAKKRGVKAPPKGQSCADRIISLKADGFFKEHRGGADIVAGLKGKGWTHKSNQVGAALTGLFERGQIQRTKEGNGSWKYYWDRD